MPQLFEKLQNQRNQCPISKRNYSAYQLFHRKEAKITKKILKNFVFFVSFWLIWTMAE